jgi:hypothetical protein
MTTFDPQAPLDGADHALLDEIADLYSAVDPVPAGLAERIRFAVSLDEIDVEMLRLVQETTLAAGARGAGRIFTFAGRAVTLTVRIVGLNGETVRLDGWLAPPAAYRITLRAQHGHADRTADEDGRFVFEETRAGLAQLVVRLADGAQQAANALATPAVVL